MPFHLSRSVPCPRPGNPDLFFLIGSREACEELMFLEDQLQKWLRSSREICKQLLFQRIQFFNWFHLFYLGYLVVTNKCLQTKLWKWNSLAQNLFFPSICWLVHSRTSTEHEQKIFRIPRTRTEQEPKKYACSFIPVSNTCLHWKLSNLHNDKTQFIQV